MNPNGESPVFDDLISKKPNGKDSVSSDEPIKCTGQSGVSSAKAVSGDSLSKKPNVKAVVSSAEPIKHSSGTGFPKSQPISSCPSLPYLPFNGGDLIKWDKARIGFYVGIDIAEGSVELEKILKEDAHIVICSCQLIWFFVYIEYTAEGLEIANSVYWIRFGEWFSQKKFKSSSPFGIEYVFTLRYLNFLEFTW
ncbi:unnamed protein product [Brassica oleracea]|uniref:mRNA (guanine-N(7))-methyltransferase n=1 Tax=Brassica napus TaxID=3708 RepID=A0A816KEE6_BRANA|nr:unnamed protein product [Brassica napus]